MQKALMFVAVFLFASLTLHAQNFSSGSTGADGALDLATMSCTTCEVQLPESGILNYTTVNVPAGKTLKFKSNSRNTSVIVLAQEAISIGGTINISANGRTPGPGGFFGGDANQPGFGPGGGQLVPGNPTGRWVGPLSLVPIIGGSGGASVNGGVGGGGGGAITIASSTSISITQFGGIFATGGAVTTYAAGGAIRLVANSLNISGQLNALASPGISNQGVIRLEAPSGMLNFTGSSNPPAVLSPINPVIISGASPFLTIVSVGGYPVPSYAGSRFNTIDLLLPNQLQDPISVVVNANNIPVGTQIQVGFVSGSGQATSTPGTLSGSFENSTATATISALTRTGVTYLLATATFDPPTSAANFNPKGPDQVSKIRVEAAPGAKPKYVFLRGNGTAIDTAKLSPQFLQQFAQ